MTLTKTDIAFLDQCWRAEQFLSELQDNLLCEWKPTERVRAIVELLDESIKTQPKPPKPR